MVRDVFLVEPSIEYKEQFQSMVNEYGLSGEQHYFDKYKDSTVDFGRYLKKLQDNAQGIDIGENSVPAITYLLTNEEGKLLGVTRIRPSMEKEYVLRYTGNIGYDIVPSQRGKGYGTIILKLSLEKARALQLDKVLITCDCDNYGSRKVIEVNGGVFESEVYNESKNILIRRYWIVL